MNCPMCGELWNRVVCQTCGWSEAPRADISPCAFGHQWTTGEGERWTPPRGTPCDCGEKRWAAPAPKETT